MCGWCCVCGASNSHTPPPTQEQKRLNRARAAIGVGCWWDCSRTNKAAAQEAEGARCWLGLGPLRGYRRREGRCHQGRECRRLIAPRGEVEVVWSCSCRNRAVVPLDGQDKDAPVHRTASHCSARPITPGRIVVTLRFFLVGFAQGAHAYDPHLVEGFGLRLDALITIQNGAQQVLAAGGE